jgi:F0F1-type ATP synthase assembly protein I
LTEEKGPEYLEDRLLGKDGNPSLRKRRLLSGRDLRASTIGWEIAIPLISGPFIGFLLDRRLDTGVRWTIILLIVGLVAAITAVIKYVQYEFYLMKKELKADEEKGIKKVWRNYDDEE